jgi:hypothetical protein
MTSEPPRTASPKNPDARARALLIWIGTALVLIPLLVVIYYVLTGAGQAIQEFSAAAWQETLNGSTAPTHESRTGIVARHFAAVVGLPAAALLALLLTLILRTSRGPIEIRALGIEFKGASGALVIWVFVFLSIALTIKLLW